MSDPANEPSYECVHCGGPVEEGFTMSESYERSGAIALVREIPCEKCRQCGATFVSDDVFAVVERQTDAAFESGSELTVLRYGASGGQGTGDDFSRAMRPPERPSKDRGAAPTPARPEIGEQGSVVDE